MRTTHPPTSDIDEPLPRPAVHAQIEQRIIQRIRERRDVGLAKYGTTVMERTDLTREQWLTHAQEEALDLAIYLEKLKLVSQTAALDKCVAALKLALAGVYDGHYSGKKAIVESIEDALNTAQPICVTTSEPKNHR